MNNKHHSREELKKLFAENIVNICFKKKDGSERKMKCTLKPELLPKQINEMSARKKAENEEVLPVWDLDQLAFRSFRIESLISFSVD